MKMCLVCEQAILDENASVETDEGDAAAHIRCLRRTAPASRPDPPIRVPLPAGGTLERRFHEAVGLLLEEHAKRILAAGGARVDEELNGRKVPLFITATTPSEAFRVAMLKFPELAAEFWPSLETLKQRYEGQVPDVMK